MSLILRYGILAGITTILYFLVFYFYDKKLLFSPLAIWSSLIFALTFMFVLGKKMMSEGKAFHEVLRSVFLIWVIADVMYYLWYYRFFNADPSLALLQKQSMLEGYNYLMAQTQNIDEIKSFHAAIEDLEKNPIYYTFQDAFVGLGRGLAGGFLLSYLMTFFLEKNYK